MPRVPNLSGTVATDRDEALEAVVTAVNAFHEKHGFMSDELQRTVARIVLERCGKGADTS